MSKMEKWSLVGLLAIMVPWACLHIVAAVTANQEAAVRVGHNLSEQALECLRVELENEEADLAGIEEGVAHPVDQILRTERVLLWFDGKNLKVQNFALFVKNGVALIYQGTPERGLDLMTSITQAGDANKVEALHYDPSNGTHSSGSHFRLIDLKSR